MHSFSAPCDTLKKYMQLVGKKRPEIEWKKVVASVQVSKKKKEEKSVEKFKLTFPSNASFCSWCSCC
jgi:hypothetical protein